MSTTYQQANRFLTMTTPLGKDKLLLVGVTGTEAISELFQIQLDAIATNETQIAFDQLLGKKITAQILAPGGSKRYISGICNRVVQGGRDPVFTAYRLEIVPEFWFLTRKSQSKIFQQMTVPDILNEVFQGLNVQIQLKGQYKSRDYCVQYRETDFHFASRLMEEEGIFYFFTHTSNNHTMVVADAPDAHPEVPFDSTATYAPLDVTNVTEDRITSWEKQQDLRSMKTTLWDHTFELPHKNLEAETPIQDTVQVGTVSHKLKIGDADKLELYDWPGEYAQRFDGVGPEKQDRPSDIQNIYTDNTRTSGIRMQQEATPALLVSGTSRLRQLTAGHRFALQDHFNANGPYVVTSVSHTARMTSDYRSGEMDEIAYDNAFTAIPFALPFRPQRVTPKPVVHGTQSAVVVGPSGQELYTDKYGRVKVQFHWDRLGQNNELSSCWVRVAQLAAGRRWGTSFWPRIGQEVIVDYLEGDPDQPIIVGTVYNADQMPPYLGKGPDSEHPEENLLSGFKSNTSMGGQGYNEWRFFDAKGKEQIFMHAQRNIDLRVLNDRMENVIGDRHLIVGPDGSGNSGGSGNGNGQGGNKRELIYKDKHLHVKGNQVELIEGNQQQTIGGGSGGNLDLLVMQTKKETIKGNNNLHVNGNHAEQVDGNQDITISGNRTESVGSNQGITVGGNQSASVGGNQSLTVGSNLQEQVGQNYALSSGMEIHLQGGMNVVIEAGMSLTLKGPGGFINIGPAGVAIQGTLVLINSGGAAGSGSGCSPDSPSSPNKPDDAQKANPTDPTKADDSVTGQKSD
jgi:type VI secretion system secreted protein VgrG